MYRCPGIALQACPRTDRKQPLLLQGLLHSFRRLRRPSHGIPRRSVCKLPRTACSGPLDVSHTPQRKRHIFQRTPRKRPLRASLRCPSTWPLRSRLERIRGPVQCKPPSWRHLFRAGIPWHNDRMPLHIRNMRRCIVETSGDS